VSPHSVVVLVLLALAALVVVLSALGLLAAPSVFARLHFLSPVTCGAAPLVGAAYVVDQGMGLASGLVLATVALLALTGPPLGAAIARLAAGEADLVPAETPE
jgi:multisubunit Na+/H+ antiporter MnhG subunit